MALTTHSTSLGSAWETCKNIYTNFDKLYDNDAEFPRTVWETFSKDAVNSVNNIKYYQEFPAQRKLVAIVNSIRFSLAVASVGIVFASLGTALIKTYKFSPMVDRCIFLVTGGLCALTIKAIIRSEINLYKEQVKYNEARATTSAKLAKIYTDLRRSAFPIDPIFVYRVYFSQRQQDILNTGTLLENLPEEELKEFYLAKLFEAYMVAILHCKHFIGPVLWTCSPDNIGSDLNAIYADLKGGKKISYGEMHSLTVERISQFMIDAINKMEEPPEYLRRELGLPLPSLDNQYTYHPPLTLYTSSATDIPTCKLIKMT